MKNYKLVPMDRSHIKEIAQIERECFSDPWSEVSLEEELYNPIASFIVAQRPDGAVLGYAGLHVGFGRENLAFLSLEVRPTNEPAIQLYYKHGFVQVGRRQNYYQNPKEDAIIMTLEFTNGTETTK